MFQCTPCHRSAPPAFPRPFPPARPSPAGGEARSLILGIRTIVSYQWEGRDSKGPIRCIFLRGAIVLGILRVTVKEGKPVPNVSFYAVVRAIDFRESVLVLFPLQYD